MSPPTLYRLYEQFTYIYQYRLNHEVRDSRSVLYSAVMLC